MKYRLYVLVFLLVPAAFFIGISCDETTTDVADAESRRALMTDLSTNVVIPLIDEFVLKAQALEVATAFYAEDATDTSMKDAAKEAWVDAITLWQRLEVMQFGPAGNSVTVMGGQDFRFSIYAWELMNRCSVDQILASSEKTYVSTTLLSQKNSTVQGLGVIEYLLYNTQTTSACSNNTTLLDSIENLEDIRATYAHTASLLVLEAAEQLQTAWSQSGGNFMAQVSGAGVDSDTYETAQEALNSVTDAMFYIETEVKDMKVAKPAGISNCSQDTCPSSAESSEASGFSGKSLDHIRENIYGFQLLFLGGDPVASPNANGFDDLLRALGQDDLSTEMTNDIAAALVALDAIALNLEDAVDSEPESVQALYSALQELCDDLKTSFASVLDIQLPDAAAGDND